MKFIKWFAEIGAQDVLEVGGKNANLGEMYRALTPLGVRVPNGFAVTAAAYRHLLDVHGAWDRLHELLDDIDPDDVAQLQQRGQAARALILSLELPAEIREEILAGYAKLREEYGDTLSLAVRSSATAEDSPGASFAGQHDTYLNIQGDEALLDAYRRCLASLFTDRAIHYRIDKGISHFTTWNAVTVMKMVRSDVGASGVMFSLDTETGFRDVVFINAAYGLGENVVQGAVDPDTFYVHKPTFEKGHRAVLKRRLGRKQIKMIFSDTLNTDNIAVEFTRNVDTTPEERQRYALTDEEVMVLADYAIKVERHYREQVYGHDQPMDMEWARDGLDGQLYMVQARPETVHSVRRGTVLTRYVLDETGPVRIEGLAVGTKIAAGPVRVIRDVSELDSFRDGEVLVADITTPDWEPVMQRASAIVTNRGGRTCHAAIVARELGLPAIVGTGNATEVLRNGEEVTVSCAEGEVGRVYAGRLKWHVEKTDLSQLPRPKTELMLNVGNPDLAFSLAALPADGVGLARMEFVINNAIKAHPRALLEMDRLDADIRARIEQLLVPFDGDAERFFVTTLSEGIATIAAAVWPRPCVVRTSDFKSNEYAQLIGGDVFEPQEANPMLGFRGAARYVDPDYRSAFALECAAIRRAREVIGMDNIIPMIPFCRTVKEAEQVVEVLAENGLKRGENGLQIYMMCEIPNNVIQADAFARHFDGFSIGSNDLTQLTLGVDRDSDRVARDYDERDPGVLEMIRLAIEGCRRNGIHSSLCGQAPSDYPEVAEFLVRHGVDAISLNPDAFLLTWQRVVEVERALAAQA